MAITNTEVIELQIFSKLYSLNLLSSFMWGKNGVPYIQFHDIGIADPSAEVLHNHKRQVNVDAGLVQGKALRSVGCQNFFSVSVDVLVRWMEGHTGLHLPESTDKVTAHRYVDLFVRVVKQLGVGVSLSAIDSFALAHPSSQCFSLASVNSSSGWHY